MLIKTIKAITSITVSKYRVELEKVICIVTNTMTRRPTKAYAQQQQIRNALRKKTKTYDHE